MWSKVREKIDRYAKLRDGWDGHDGKAPTQEIVKTAKQYAASMEACGFALPFVTVLSDGNIDFWWEAGGHEMFVSTDASFSACFSEAVILTKEQSAALKNLLAPCASMIFRPGRHSRASPGSSKAP